MSRPVSIGIRPPHALFEGGGDRLRTSIHRIAQSGIDRVCVGDHVSFQGGQGFDGLVQATALAALCDLEIATAVYLVPLRHPVPVARQVSSLSQLAPGRFVFGVGVGGEDPNELRACGVEPTTRGRRMNESLAIIRSLLAGETVTTRGEFFDLDAVRLLPTSAQPVPIVVGGRSEAALRRTGRLGDGWLGIWVTPERWAAGASAVEQHAAEAQRTGVEWRHALQVWCGFSSNSTDARSVLAGTMEGLYKSPFEKFERYAPYGTPQTVAGRLSEFVDAGCREINVIAVAADPDEATDAVAEVAAQLRRQ